MWDYAIAHHVGGIWRCANGLGRGEALGARQEGREGADFAAVRRTQSWRSDADPAALTPLGPHASGSQASGNGGVEGAPARWASALATYEYNLPPTLLPDEARLYQARESAGLLGRPRRGQRAYPERAPPLGLGARLRDARRREPSQREALRLLDLEAEGAAERAQLPVDVAEAIAWYCNPASNGVNGNVVRVCGQSLIGK